LVSSIDSKNGVPPLVQADFIATWNWDTGLSTIKPTTGAWGAWLGKGSDVIIRRLEMKSLFHRVVLVNRDVILNGGSGQTAYYRMNGLPVASPASLGTANPIIDSYYIDGSVLALYTNGASGPGLSVSEVVKKDESRIFESNAWRDSISAGPPLANNLTSLADAFLSSSSPPAGNKRGDNTYGVGDMLLSYMSAYSSWANMSPCFSFEGQGNNKFVPEYVLLNNVITCFGNPGNGSCQIMP
jgi:hypothetical protein